MKFSPSSNIWGCRLKRRGPNWNDWCSCEKTCWILSLFVCYYLNSSCFFLGGDTWFSWNVLATTRIPHFSDEMKIHDKTCKNPTSSDSDHGLILVAQALPVGGRFGTLWFGDPKVWNLLFPAPQGISIGISYKKGDDLGGTIKIILITSWCDLMANLIGSGDMLEKSDIKISWQIGRLVN